jgi:hypothetical protein
MIGFLILLLKGEGFAVDASVMEANASRYHGKAPDELDWTDAQRQKRAVAEYLAALEAEAGSRDDLDRANALSNKRIVGRVRCCSFGSRERYLRVTWPSRPPPGYPRMSVHDRNRRRPAA